LRVLNTHRDQALVRRCGRIHSGHVESKLGQAVDQSAVATSDVEDARTRRGRRHPEVGICISCVHFLRRQARDHQATVMRQTLRGAAESVRGQVMARGWHQRLVIGPALQWLNRHLPW